MDLIRPEGALKAILVSRSGRAWIDAGRLSVDFAMTGPGPELGSAAARWEALHGPDDLADWLTACDLRLGPLEVRPADVAGALDLRAAIWGLTSAAIELCPRPRGAVTTVNAYAARVPLVPQIGSTGLRWAAPTTAQALATIARDAITLHADPKQRARLRECVSLDCGRVFYDTSRPGTRRWCDPVRCGDRQRARTYRRTRPVSHRPRPDQHHEMEEH